MSDFFLWSYFFEDMCVQILHKLVPVFILEGENNIGLFALGIGWMCLPVFFFLRLTLIGIGFLYKTPGLALIGAALTISLQRYFHNEVWLFSMSQCLQMPTELLGIRYCLTSTLEMPVMRIIRLLLWSHIQTRYLKFFLPQFK